MNVFSLGQRWINQARPELGLGTVVNIEGRVITLSFGLEQVSQTFAADSAPLARIQFSPGDVVRNYANNEFAIVGVEEQEALFIYIATGQNGEEHALVESEISPTQSFNRPVERLLHGQIDDDRWFSLRTRTLNNRTRLYADSLWGMLGGRTQLLPHQLYVVNEVARRYAPRVLLADEVGLGKTIEAGLIAHYQLVTERARRVLIVVPASLMHQWLVEMIRRFNLMFSVFDAERCDAMEEAHAGSAVNPFQEEQLVICTLEFLVENPHRHVQCVDAGWDLCIVDEAHHLHWHEGRPGENYQVVEALAGASAGMLLLTGTPRQLGLAGHFARLRLLDPARYQDLESFEQEQTGFQRLAELVEKILVGQSIALSEYAEYLSAEDVELLDTEPEFRNRLIDRLLDHYGVGRVMYRNTRASVGGFPARELFTWPLDVSEAWREKTARIRETDTSMDAALHPERFLLSEDEADQWPVLDPRVNWLADFLLNRPGEKALVICAGQLTASTLCEALKHGFGIRSAVFHERMSMLERDRAAAWFAETEEGCQALICSEIGSEGRNFQFAHNLVLFDLPLSPDLLEQRIGRLDRIGREDTVAVHVPVLTGEPQARLFSWYQDALDAFTNIGTVNQLVFERFRDEVESWLRTGEQGQLIEQASAHRQALEAEMRSGRDRLLEFHSCRREQADELVSMAQHADNSVELFDWMEHAFGCYDINMETYRQDSVLIKPGERLVTPVPGLNDEGVIATFKRGTALENEDLQFLTFEHPLVVAISDLVLNTERGNTAMTGVRGSALGRTELAIEFIFIIEVGGVVDAEVLSRVPPLIEHIVVHESGRRMDDLVADTTGHVYINLKAKLRRQVVDIKRKQIQAAVLSALEQAESTAAARLQASARQSMLNLGEEIARLKRLRESNPAVRQEEIDHLETLNATLETAVTEPRVRLDSLRVLLGV